MRIGVLRERYPSERRVAVVPNHVELYRKLGHEVLLETGAGEGAFFPDNAYTEAGAQVLPSHEAVIDQADLILAVRTGGANPLLFPNDLSLLREGQILIGFMEPLYRPQYMAQLAERGVTAFAMELIPRITRAQNMDALSSMATVAGYKAVLLAGSLLPSMFPLLMTAAGTISPARVFVIGAGVAGLQAMATAKRLGASVEGYDVRPATRDQVESVGAKFIEISLEVEQAEASGGYARALEEETLQRQQQLLGEHLIRQEVIITTAAVPGKRAPLLIPQSVVEQMRPGTVIIDLTAEYGGNCELTPSDPDQSERIFGLPVRYHRNVIIVGAMNLPATVPTDASLLYSRNLYNLVAHLSKVNMFTSPDPNHEDPIARETLVTFGGQVVNERVRSALN